MKKIQIILVLLHYSILALCQNVGIGTPTPDHTLDINGTVGINEAIFHNNDTDTWMGFTANDTWEVAVGGKPATRVDAIGSTLIINPDQSSVNFLISSDGINANNFAPNSASTPPLFFADVSGEQIGIGTDQPTELLEIQGGNMLISGDGINPLLFVDTDQNRVGIGTATPQAKLEVAGTFKTDTLQADYISMPNNIQSGSVLITGMTGQTVMARTISFQAFNTKPKIIVSIEDLSQSFVDTYSHSVSHVTTTSATIQIQEPLGSMYGDIQINWIAIE